MFIFGAFSANILLIFVPFLIRNFPLPPNFSVNAIFEIALYFSSWAMQHRKKQMCIGCQACTCAHVQQLECYKVALLSMRATSSSSPGPELMSFQRYFSSFLDSQLALYSLAPLLVMLCYANNHSNSKLHHQQRPSIGSCLRFPLQLHGRLPLRMHHYRWGHHTLVFHPD